MLHALKTATILGTLLLLTGCAAEETQDQLTTQEQALMHAEDTARHAEGIFALREKETPEEALEEGVNRAIPIVESDGVTVRADIENTKAVVTVTKNNSTSQAAVCFETNQGIFKAYPVEESPC